MDKRVAVDKKIGAKGRGATIQRFSCGVRSQPLLLRAIQSHWLRMTAFLGPLDGPIILKNGDF
jgi:hypothetical protein